jgi:hypothetical protein
MSRAWRPWSLDQPRRPAHLEPKDDVTYLGQRSPISPVHD